MTRARKCLIDLASTSYYHLIARCVRRAYLCGDDPYSGKNFDHRRTWLIERIKHLSTIFAIDIAAYAVMSNHYHLVVKVNRAHALNWSDDEVITRWYKLYRGHPLVDQHTQGQRLDAISRRHFDEIIATWRARLYDISWYMKNLNEHIAREANKEDNCTGKYWEGRYQSQGLLDHASIIRCMAYVDLNPIRAKAADSLEHSDFTSIQERILHFQALQNNSNNNSNNNTFNVNKKQDDSQHLAQPAQLKPFAGNHVEHAIPFALSDYLALVDWSGRQINPQKAGHIDNSTPKILTTLGLDEAVWMDSIKHFRRQYSHFAGAPQRLKLHAAKNDMKWYKGTG